VGFVADIKGRRSHTIVKNAVEVLLNLEHRGASGRDANSGDGAGILIQTPHEFFLKQCSFELPAFGQYAVGSVFLPVSAAPRKQCEAILEQVVVEEGQRLIGWRDVPTNDSLLGPTARDSKPIVRQVFIARNNDLSDDSAFERKLYVIRRRASRAVKRSSIAGFYISSLSYKTVVYKGMLTASQLPQFYPDLVDESLTSALAIVHSRFSTNTFPSWARAHPYRYLAHNGEINTLRGNVNWMHARESRFASKLFAADLEKVLPVIDADASDSGMFDNALEMFLLAGRSLPHALMMMVPEPWTGDEFMSPERRAFYEYHSLITEPWDGPAAIVFSDGFTVGALLDRNGLRPARYYITSDDLVVMASEAGVLDIPAGEEKSETGNYVASRHKSGAYHRR
jgi:glutamate synthase (ferredoxin)